MMIFDDKRKLVFFFSFLIIDRVLTIHILEQKYEYNVYSAM